MGDSGYFADKRTKNKTLQKKEDHDCEHNKHEWSNWFSVPAGLGKECKICHNIKMMEKKDMKEAFK
jgi:nitrate/TMAO reductase-like tetraheme cytochrome c subunit